MRHAVAIRSGIFKSACKQPLLSEVHDPLPPQLSPPFAVVPLCLVAGAFTEVILSAASFNSV